MEKRQLLYTPKEFKDWLEECKKKTKVKGKGKTVRKKVVSAESVVNSCENDENDENKTNQKLFEGIPYTTWKNRMEEGWDVDKTLLERAIEWMKEMESEVTKKCQKQQKHKRKSAKNKQKGAKKQKVAEKAKPKEKEVTRNTCDCDGEVAANMRLWMPSLKNGGKTMMELYLMLKKKSLLHKNWRFPKVF